MQEDHRPPSPKRRVALAAAGVFLLLLVGFFFWTPISFVFSLVFAEIAKAGIGLGLLVLGFIAVGILFAALSLAGQITLTTQSVVHRQVLFVAFICTVLSSTYGERFLYPVFTSLGVQDSLLGKQRAEGIAALVVMLATVSYFGNFLSDAAKSVPDFSRTYSPDSGWGALLSLSIGLYRATFDVLLPLCVSLLTLITYSESTSLVAREIGCALVTKSALSATRASELSEQLCR